MHNNMRPSATHLALFALSVLARGVLVSGQEGSTAASFKSVTKDEFAKMMEDAYAGVELKKGQTMQGIIDSDFAEGDVDGDGLLDRLERFQISGALRDSTPRAAAPPPTRDDDDPRR